jgi:hypothetical protein
MAKQYCQPFLKQVWRFYLPFIIMLCVFVPVVLWYKYDMTPFDMLEILIFSPTLIWDLIGKLLFIFSACCMSSFIIRTHYKALVSSEGITARTTFGIKVYVSLSSVYEIKLNQLSHLIQLKSTNCDRSLWAPISILDSEYVQKIIPNNTLKCVSAKKTASTGRAKRTPFS